MRGFSSSAEISEEVVPLMALAGAADEDFRDAFRVFAASCQAIVKNKPALRPAIAPPPAFIDICRQALIEPPADAAAARRFFERFFEPRRLLPSGSQAGFVTGYYEPVVDGSLEPDQDHLAPLYGRPDDLISLNQEEALDRPDGPLQAARMGLDGLEPYPDRAAIEGGALGDRAKALVWLKDKAEVFFIQVQGSARVRLRDGSELRLTYAGRNGHPYTSIGRILIDEEKIPAEQAGLTGLKQWIRDQGQAAGAAGSALMLRNKSYVFFSLSSTARLEEGPIGGQGIPLTGFRSIALDRAIWPYGLPMWIVAELPWQSSEPTKFGRLMIGQDTGSAIVGAARGDLFFGSGETAGALAGAIRHPAEFTVLLPRDPNGRS